jgi:UDP-2,3-diacylglucosamine hydrolase
MDALFISDLHLDDSRPELLEGFVRFMEVWGVQSRRLFILGDLFELWIGDDQPGPAAGVVRRALSELAARGVEIGFMAGNRDFLLGTVWAAGASMRLLDPPGLQTLGAQRVLMSHGDELCLDDTDYQQFKKMVRDPRWIQAFLQRPLETRLQMARGMRKESQSRAQGAPEYLTDVSVSAVEQAFSKCDARLMVHGHVHRPALHQHTVAGRNLRRIVLGDWGEMGWMATIEGASSQLLSFPIRQPAMVRRCGT